MLFGSAIFVLYADGQMFHVILLNCYAKLLLKLPKKSVQQTENLKDRHFIDQINQCMRYLYTILSKFGHLCNDCENLNVFCTIIE